MHHSIYHDALIKASSERIFEAITQPDHLINWWPLAASGKPKEGVIYNFNFTDEYDWYGEVSAVEKNKEFEISMTQSDEDWDGTKFRFEIEQVENGVNLKFSHIGRKTINHYFRRTSTAGQFCFWDLKIT